ncbi:hypothetical protein BC937DRAFT_86480 [Endogone sp. FLAS-F59071]|nr:hypothetical protein BC937DRAFT_86480 [Endogone sp. FLAS-F59071]|eukprot:RUS20060.1 hypothetical protein BC937DRAFT_86480 [Endogone sp. FLAS-F59071]
MRREIFDPRVRVSLASLAAKSGADQSRLTFNGINNLSKLDFWHQQISHVPTMETSNRQNQPLRVRTIYRVVFWPQLDPGSLAVADSAAVVAPYTRHYYKEEWRSEGERSDVCRSQDRGYKSKRKEEIELAD